MKRRTQRIFISLLAFFIAWFAIANAYTFEVVNWSPFWVLNLQKLILKGWTTSTWIILDWKEYVIKIDPEHENNGWQIRVYEICDESGNNCREVSSLYTGTQGVPWPQWNTWADGVWIQEISSEKVWKTTTVTVTYTNWETLSFDILDWNDGTGVNWWWIAFTNNSQNNYICRKSWDAVTCNGLKLSTYPQNNRLCYVKDNVLYCDQVNLFEELSGRINDVSGNINNWALIIYKWWTQITFTANQSGNKTIQLWPIWWSNWNVCVKSWDDISCNTSVKLWAMSWQKRCYYDGTSINCNQNVPEGSNWSWASGLFLTPAGTNDRICIKQSDNTIYCNIAQDYYATANDLANEITRVIAMINALIDHDTWLPNALNQSGYVAAPSKSKDTNKVRKTDDVGNPGWRDDAGWTTYTAWDSIRIDWNKISVIQNTTITSGYVTPPWTNTYNKYRWTNGAGVLGWHTISGGWSWVTLLTWQNGMYCKYIVQSKDGWLDCTYAGWWWDSVWIEQKNGDWIYQQNENHSVAIWPTSGAIWTSSGNVRLFVNWNTVIADNGMSVAKLGQGGVWFMGANDFYMGKVYNGTFWRTVQQIYGVSIAWPIAIGYDDNNTWNYIYIYSEWSTTNSGRHFEIMWSYELAVWTISGWFIYFNQPSTNEYEKYSIWVNTNDPKATLDIQWGVKVWNDCMTCSSTTYWTIIYYGNDFYWCKPHNGSPKWISLTNWNPISVSYSVGCNSPIFYHSEIANQTQALAK